MATAPTIKVGAMNDRDKSESLTATPTLLMELGACVDQKEAP